jgi:hypothetical protein
MRLLYSLLLHLYPARIRAEFGDEMVDVFDEAAAAERQRGGTAYARFCAREAAGLLFNLMFAENLMKHKRAVLYGCVAGLLIGGAIGAARANRNYTSTAVLRTTPQTVPERFIGAAPVENERMLQNAVQDTGSTGNLINIINTFNLYPAERKRKRIEDVADEMRRTIVLTPPGRDIMRISFSYEDRFVAQKVTADLTARILAAHARQRANTAMVTVLFLNDRVKLAASEWETNLERLRTAQREGKPIDRLRLDADISRQRYENLSAKAAEAEMIEDLEKRQQGPSVEVLDPASLPSEAKPSPYAIAGLGAIAGALIGLLVSSLLALRPRPAVVQA